MALPPPSESGWEAGTRRPSSTARQPPPSSPLPWETTWPLASSPAVLGSLGRVTAITTLGTGLKIRRARRAAGHGGAWGHAGPHGAKGAAAPLPAGDGDTAGRRPALGLHGARVGTYSVEAEAGEEGEGSVQSLEASHPAWLPAPGTADVPSPVPASHGGARSLQPGHPRSLHSRYRDVPWARPPHRPPLPRAGGSGCPSAGRGLWLCPSFHPAPDSLAGRPSPSPTQRGRGGGWRRQGWGSLPWLEPLPGDPSLAAGFGAGRLPAALPRRAIFSWAGTRAQGAGLPSMSRFLPCSAVAGSWEPGPPLPLPWKLAPALGNAPRPQFPP